MKINAALAKLKNLKSKVARIDGFITESLVFYEGDQPEYVYAEEVEARRELLTEIRSLKVRIMQTNAVTKVSLGENNPATSLNDLILLNAECRSELAHWTKLLATTVETPYAARNKDSIKKVYAPGFNKAEIKAKINQLEKSKEKIEAWLAEANAETDLVG